MSARSPAAVAAVIEHVGLLPLFYSSSISKAVDMARGCAEGGAGAIEFTNRGPDAASVFARLVEIQAQTRPDLVLGVGSVIDVNSADLFIKLGARFVVGPYFVPAVAKLCKSLRVLYVPGGLTPAEIGRAEQAGAPIVKLFPARSVGPNFVRDLLGPCPWSRILPTGGVSADEQGVRGWIRAGAVALGIGSQLIPESSASADSAHMVDALAEHVSSILAWIADERARGSGLVKAGGYASEGL